MWKGESLCMNSMNRDKYTASSSKTTTSSSSGGSSSSGSSSSTADMKKLLVGITWREHPTSNPKYSRVDLDLTVNIYDENMKKLDYCSYSHLTCHGCVHSGDITSAPYNKGGAREDVVITLNELPKGRFNTHYIRQYIQVY